MKPVFKGISILSLSNIYDISAATQHPHLTFPSIIDAVDAPYYDVNIGVDKRLDRHMKSSIYYTAAIKLLSLLIGNATCHWLFGHSL